MIEIRYGENSQQADLAGRSVAEAREQYQAVFDIPGKARARLNDKQVKPKLEPETLLSDGDELSFEVKAGSRKPLLVGALMFALVLTGGVFAFTYTTASITGATLNAVGADFAAVTANATTFTWWHESDNLTKGLVGRISGSMRTHDLFYVSPSDNYTGDIEIKVYLANAGHLRYAYKHFNLKLECTDSVEADAETHEMQLLTLENAEVLFHRQYSEGWGATENRSIVKLTGGSWHTLASQPLGWSSGAECSPQLYCEVQPRQS